MLGRRALLGAGIGAGLTLAARPAWAAEDAELAAIRTAVGGRIGLFALDIGSGRTIALAADGRFAMCSTFKLPLAAAVLAAADEGRLRLDQPVRFGEGDLLPYAPVVRAHVAEGVLPVDMLAEAAVTLSDNSAANLLLPLIGGPAGLTIFARAQGDGVTRFDRTEPRLNTNLSGDPRDTTTPRAMVRLMRRLLVGGGLSVASRGRLIGWLVACGTGRARLRAGLPQGWRAGDKTGTGERGAANDVAIVWPPGRAPILIACFVDAQAATPAARDAAHAAVGALVARRFA